MRALPALSLVIVLIDVAIAKQAAATTWLVPSEVPDLAAALAKCAAGDTVEVEDGIYRGPGNRNLMMPPFDVIIRSRNGADGCIIDCENESPWLSIAVQDDPRMVTIEGFQVTRARHAVYSLGGPVLIRDCIFDGNGAGTGAGGALYSLSQEVVVEDCVFRRNDVGVSGQGGAAWVGFGEASFIRCLFEHNHAGYGGAINGGTEGKLRLESCTVTENVSEFSGGGIDFGSGNLVLQWTIVYGNRSNRDQADEIFALHQSSEPTCCDLRQAGIVGPNWTFEASIDADPRFCDAGGPDNPAYPSDYRLRCDSPCLPQFSPCGSLIGALDEGCGASHPVGACCVGGSCILLDPSDCEAAGGAYRGDDVSCYPDPCAPVAVRTVTWGQLKAHFRTQGSHENRPSGSQLISKKQG